ncbi:MAG: CPBP family intramembrane metalloprotease [Croceicoccus sp.]|nr:CPBP family intramembrane metalloprotease [Croceicoccus sp.]|tara:strand:+ start:10022 stop:10669 length:648 start_codon:yes stop_codon:yes gene_type:complete
MVPMLAHPVVRVLVAALIVGGGMFAPIPFPFKVPILAALALIVVWLETGGLAAAGLRRPARWSATFAWALLGAVLIVVGIGEIVLPLIEKAAGIEPDYSGYGALKGNLKAVLTMIAFAMVSAAIAEEIVFRGYLLHVLTSLLGEGRGAKAISVIVSAAVFAVPHYEQGPIGMVTVFLTGLILGWLFFQTRRNLFALIIAHGLVDIWGLGSLYFGV